MIFCRRRRSWPRRPSLSPWKSCTRGITASSPRHERHFLRYMQAERLLGVLVSTASVVNVWRDARRLNTCILGSSESQRERRRPHSSARHHNATTDSVSRLSFGSARILAGRSAVSSRDERRKSPTTKASIAMPLFAYSKSGSERFVDGGSCESEKASRFHPSGPPYRIFSYEVPSPALLGGSSRTGGLHRLRLRRFPSNEYRWAAALQAASVWLQ